MGPVLLAMNRDHFQPGISSTPIPSDLRSANVRTKDDSESPSEPTGTPAAGSAAAAAAAAAALSARPNFKPHSPPPLAGPPSSAGGDPHGPPQHAKYEPTDKPPAMPMTPRTPTSRPLGATATTPPTTQQSPAPAVGGYPRAPELPTAQASAPGHQRYGAYEHTRPSAYSSATNPSGRRNTIPSRSPPGYGYAPRPLSDGDPYGTGRRAGNGIAGEHEHARVAPHPGYSEFPGDRRVPIFQNVLYPAPPASAPGRHQGAMPPTTPSSYDDEGPYGAEYTYYSAYNTPGGPGGPGGGPGAPPPLPAPPGAARNAPGALATALIPGPVPGPPGPQTPGTYRHARGQSGDAGDGYLWAQQPSPGAWDARMLGSGALGAPLGGPLGGRMPQQRSHPQAPLGYGDAEYGAPPLAMWPPLPGHHRRQSSAGEPKLQRTSSLTQAANQWGLGPRQALPRLHGMGSGPAGDLPAQQAQLRIDGDLEGMMLEWTQSEYLAQRRLVRFERYQDGAQVRLVCSAMTQESYNGSEPKPPTVSCIMGEDDKGHSQHYVTSVDCISILELIIGQKFSVEEKNRIRRNLEVCKPVTVSKSKPESAKFFRLIMDFDEPKPRNIEKDVKVFLWQHLAQALFKIVSKYSADYQGNADRD